MTQDAQEMPGASEGDFCILYALEQAECRNLRVEIAALGKLLKTK